MTNLNTRSKTFLDPEETIWRVIETKKNIKTLYIRKDKVSYHQIGKSSESTGSRTGVFSFGKKYTNISSLLNKYITYGKNRFNGLPQLKIALPEGKYMTVKFRYVVKRFSNGWERSTGTTKIDVKTQRKKL